MNHHSGPILTMADAKAPLILCSLAMILIGVRLFVSWFFLPGLEADAYWDEGIGE